jgi:hypothetical protein
MGLGKIIFYAASVAAAYGIGYVVGSESNIKPEEHYRIRVEREIYNTPVILDTETGKRYFVNTKEKTLDEVTKETMRYVDKKHLEEVFE